MRFAKHDSGALASEADGIAADGIPQAQIDAVHDAIARHVGGNLDHARQLASEGRVARMLLAVGTVSFGFALEGLLRGLAVSPDRAQLIERDILALV